MAHGGLQKSGVCLRGKPQLRRECHRLFVPPRYALMGIMTDYAILEIGLHEHNAENYRAELSLKMPEEDAKRTCTEAISRFNLADLAVVARDNPSEYGPRLTSALFANESLRSFFSTACAMAKSSIQAPLRLRLRIGPTLPELHDLRWESLCHPYNSERRLATDENILFSRYVDSEDWRAVRIRSRGDLKALVVIANPEDLYDWRPNGRSLAPVDVDGELERARTGLAGIPLTLLASRGTATLEALGTYLSTGYDILYLVCHGAFEEAGPHLYLEDEAGNVEATAGADLLARILEIEQPPLLVVLASCQSAGVGGEWRSTDGGALAPLGPRLAEIGIPAVLAMQGNVAMGTVARFMPKFFSELIRDGRIDRAMAVARRAVREHSDWWVPVLFTRLESGRLFAEEEYIVKSNALRVLSAMPPLQVPIPREDLLERSKLSAEAFEQAEKYLIKKRYILCTMKKRAITPKGLAARQEAKE